MKLSLIAYVAQVESVLEFFKKDPRFTLRHPVTFNDLDIYIGDTYTHFFLSGDGTLQAEEIFLESDGDIEEESGVVRSELLQELIRQFNAISDGDLKELKSFADNLVLFKELK